MIERLRQRWEWLAVAALVAVMGVELGVAMRSDGITIDEIVYIGSGYRHLVYGDFRPNPEQPTLTKLLGAVPLRYLHLKVPPIGEGEGASSWHWSFDFVQKHNDPVPIVTWARVPNACLTIVLALLLWGWARATLGPLAALVALTLTAFHTSLLAHGHFLTTDMPGTVTMVAGSLAYWWWSRAPSVRRGLVVALVVGVAVSTRLTGWLLPVIYAVLETVAFWQAPERGRRGWHTLRLVALGLVLVPACLWASYGFRFQPWPGVSIFNAPGEWLGGMGRLLTFLHAHRLLPEPYLEGARYVGDHNAFGHPTYLLGEMSAKGWPHYYLVALLAKSTPAFLIVLLAAAALVVARWRAVVKGSIELHWLLPAALIFAAASAGRIQIGERYILPLYPFVILLAAAAAVPLWRTRAGRAAVVVVLVGNAASSVMAAPGGYLSYFNVFAGGRDGGHRVLCDSNIDWGQDLPRLKTWMDANLVPIVQLGYHGSDDPDRFGIRHEDLPGMLLYATTPPAQPFRGTIAVSPNLLMGIFYPPNENPYEQLKHREPDARAGVYFIFRND